MGALFKEGHPRAASKIVERCRPEGDAVPDERTSGTLQAASSTRWGSYGRRCVGGLLLAACPFDAGARPGDVYSRRDAGRGGRGESVTCNSIMNTLKHADRFRNACNLLDKFPLYLAIRWTRSLTTSRSSCCARLELVVQVRWELMDLRHFLCRSHQFEEACVEFENFFERGLYAQYITYKVLMKYQLQDAYERAQVTWLGWTGRLVGWLMRSVPYSTKLRVSYREKEGDNATLVAEKWNMVVMVYKFSKSNREDWLRYHAFRSWSPKQFIFHMADYSLRGERRYCKL